MKSLLVTIIGIFILTTNTSCQSEIPGDVISAFNKKFVEAEKAKWEQEKNNEWEAGFILNGEEMTACFDAGGKWLETEMEMEIEDLPAAVFKTMYLEFEEFEIEECEGIETPEFKGFEIEIEVEDDGKETEFEVLITVDGQLIKKVEEEDEDNDGDDDDHDDGDNDDDDDHNGDNDDD